MMPSKQCGVPRDWSSNNKRENKFSGVRSGSAHFVNSVTDLYVEEEIDALLDEIQDLEPLSIDTDDFLRDLEINHQHHDSPAAVVPPQLLPYSSMTYCDSRASVHSWDSHALYSTHENGMEDVERRSVGGPVSVYCDSNHLKTPIGILRIILLITSMVCLGLLCTSGTAIYGLFSLPYVSRIRLMLFVILFTALVTVLLLFLDISLLYHAFPFHYHRMAASIYITECAAFIGSSALIVNLTQIYQEAFPWIAKVTRDQLIAASVFGFLSGLVAFLLAAYGLYEICHLHFPKREDTDQLTLTERAQQQHQQQQQIQQQQQMMSNQGNSSSKYQPAPQSEPPVTTTVWPIDDVQPCSSKHFH